MMPCVSDRHSVSSADRRSSVQAAARNNAEWCDAVCRAHGLPGDFGAAAWTNPRRTPPYYPDAVTLTASASGEDVLDRIDTSSRGCSVKDSFARIDLAPLGFRVLLQAEWIYRPADERVPRPQHVRWTQVLDGTALLSWEAAWRGNQEVPDLFRPQLLADDSVAFLCGYSRGSIVAGLVAKRSASVVGISNLFSSDGDVEAAWAGGLGGR